MLFLIALGVLVVGGAIIIRSKLVQMAPPAAGTTESSADKGGPWGNGPVPSSAPVGKAYAHEKLTLWVQAPAARQVELQKVVSDAIEIATSTARLAGQTMATQTEVISAASIALKNAGVSMGNRSNGIPLTVEARAVRPLDAAAMQEIEHDPHAITLTLPGGLTREQYSALGPKLAASFRAHPEIIQALRNGDHDRAQSLAETEVQNMLLPDGATPDPSLKGPRIVINVNASLTHPVIPPPTPPSS